MAKESFFLSREALYIKVWETPTIKLAKEFNVSDVAIGKMCRRLNVPKPPLGYWRRVETGSKKKIPPLSKPDNKTKAGVWIYPKSEEKTLQFEDEYNEQSLVIEQNIAEQTVKESLPENKIKVANTLHKPHTLVAQTREILSKGTIDTYGAVGGKWGEKHLSLRVSKKHLNRALRIMDALLKALEKRGCKTIITIDRQLKTEVQLKEIKVEITLREDFKRFERQLSAEEKKSNYVSDRYYYEPTGNFTFSINNVIDTQHNWRDGKTSLLEEQLNNIVLGVFRVAEELRQKEIARKNEERKQLELSLEREKLKIFQKRQVDCRELFTELLSKWQKSQDIQKFLSSYKAKTIEEQGEISLDSDEALLIEWATDYSEKLDPTKNNQLQGVIDKIKHLKDGPVEEDSYEYSNILWKLRMI